MPDNRHIKIECKALAFREKLFAFNYGFCLTEQTHIAEQIWCKSSTFFEYANVFARKYNYYVIFAWFATILHKKISTERLKAVLLIKSHTRCAILQFLQSLLKSFPFAICGFVNAVHLSPPAK